MIKLQIKNIKGNKYLYFSESLKVISKSLSIQLYGGRIDKITLNEFYDKQSEYNFIRLTKFLDYRVGHYHA